MTDRVQIVCENCGKPSGWHWGRLRTCDASSFKNPTYWKPVDASSNRVPQELAEVYDYAVETGRLEAAAWISARTTDAIPNRVEEPGVTPPAFDPPVTGVNTVDASSNRAAIASQWCQFHNCHQDDPRHEYIYEVCEGRLRPSTREEDDAVLVLLTDAIPNRVTT